MRLHAAERPARPAPRWGNRQLSTATQPPTAQRPPPPPPAPQRAEEQLEAAGATEGVQEAFNGLWALGAFPEGSLLRHRRLVRLLLGAVERAHEANPDLMGRPDVRTQRLKQLWQFHLELRTAQVQARAKAAAAAAAAAEPAPGANVPESGSAAAGGGGRGDGDDAGGLPDISPALLQVAQQQVRGVRWRQGGQWPGLQAHRAL